jgi:hypothetical protein
MHSGCDLERARAAYANILWVRLELKVMLRSKLSSHADLAAVLHEGETSWVT